MRTAIVTLLLVAALSVAPRAAALEPDEIAVVAVRRSEKSRLLAEHYVQERGLPEDRICLIDVAPGKNLSREEWIVEVRPFVRQWIAERDLATKLKCLVTVWDVPLKIDRFRDGGLRDVYLDAERRERLGRLADALAAVERLGAEDAHEPRTEPADLEDVAIDELRKNTVATLEAARARIAALEDDDARRRDTESLGRHAFALIGLAVGAREQPGTEATEEQARTRDRLAGRMFGLAEGRAALEQLPETVSRDEKVLELVERRDGLLGSLGWIDAQRRLLEKNETYSSFDSELSLLYWIDYPLLRWQPNLLHHRFDGSPLRRKRPTLMVARLEAPTWELSRGLVDTALEVEKTGLDGKFYVDARGLKVGKDRQPGSYADYDEALRTLAGEVESHSDWKLVLDDESALFAEGTCPDAALYCGWYSLSNYVDAFDWKRGAVAYHMASGEAATLRDPRSKVWCKRMLEDGVCATLGPVYEPYLAAFPRPDEFFPTLLTGEYTLAEAYYRTKPFNSWVMTLVGDPLYNPFRGRPGIRVEELPESLRKIVRRPDEADLGNSE